MSVPHAAAAAIWRIESARLIAVAARLVGRVDLAEEIVQEAFAEALGRWEQAGVPESPGAWLMTAVRHRAVDHLRHERRAERKHETLRRETEASFTPDLDGALDRVIADDLLRLIFAACHPVLREEGRVALTLRLLGGLGVDEIARAYFVPEATIAQRITRAKRTLAERQVPFELPPARELGARLGSVLEVIYLVFNEGYLATAGEDWMRPALCDEALRLGRTLAELTPDESEVHGLLALMELQASRARARVGRGGEAVLLHEQDRTQWDALLLRRGLEGLTRAAETARERPGPYLLQAAIAGCHARAVTAEQTDWARIAALYDVLAEVAPSPVVELNRAVAIGRTLGPAEGLRIVDALAGEPSLRDYPFLPSVRAELLSQLGRYAEAREEVLRAATRTRNERERALFLRRAEDYAAPVTPRGRA